MPNFYIIENNSPHFLKVKESKIIAMTCTHAALRRRELVELGFHYDNILMEEAAQILEVETFIPLLLQDPHDGRSRLKRFALLIPKFTKSQRIGSRIDSFYLAWSI